MSRGYQSSVSPILNFGLGNEETINLIEVVWHDGKISKKEDVKVNQSLTFMKEEAQIDSETIFNRPTYLTRLNPKAIGVEYRHKENNFNDFSKQVLLPQKQSQQGPPFATVDINNDGLTDLFFGGALDQPSEIYIQNVDGTFNKKVQSIFETDKNYEDNGAHFFDADTDGDLDLYVASGGYELDESDALLQDRLYLNDGDANFTKSNALPKMLTSTKAVVSLDYDDDGDLDLIVGGRVIPGKYPLSPKSYILNNSNGRFTDVTNDVAPDLNELGIINDIIVSDYDGDNDKDLIVVGEWMPITIFNNENKTFKKQELSTLTNTEGWWNTISEIDFDNDGDMDYFVGNIGGNNKFHPSEEKPLHIYGNNFDTDGNYDMILSKLYHGNLVPVRGKECSTSQNPFVSEKIKSYKEFANSTLGDIYGEEVLENSFHKKATEFESVYLENKGDGIFEVHHLPTLAQLGPTLSFVFVDINKDGHLDVVGSGAIHEAEVETVKYDSNIGYILLGDSKGGLEPFKDVNFYNPFNAKNMKLVTVKDNSYLFIANNNRPLTIFKIN
ncbi:MAG: FG-GAP-like repeat-containing protein [Flavobacteriaceae bacterium]